MTETQTATATLDPQAAREQRGLIIAATCKLQKKGKAWIVPSQAGTGKYTVVPDANEPHCSCMDHETTGLRCKHIFAVQITIKREEHEDGSVTEVKSVTVTETRKTYPQNWPAYNKRRCQRRRRSKPCFGTWFRKSTFPSRPRVAATSPSRFGMRSLRLASRFTARYRAGGLCAIWPMPTPRDTLAACRATI